MCKGFVNGFIDMFRRRPIGSVSSMTAVRSMSVGPVMPFHGPEHTSEASEAKIRHRSVASTAVLIDTCGDDALGGVAIGSMTAKERARSLALSQNCRRCLSCETLYDLVRSSSGCNAMQYLVAHS